MFDKRLAYTGAAIIIVAALSLVLSSAPDIPEIAPLAETVSGVERQEQKNTPPLKEPDTKEDYAYTLKEHNGRVAVFPAGSGEPELVLDVFVKYLPDLDRTQMQQGIQVKDYEELVKLIEDYTS